MVRKSTTARKMCIVFLGKKLVLRRCFYEECQRKSTHTSKTIQRALSVNPKQRIAAIYASGLRLVLAKHFYLLQNFTTQFFLLRFFSILLLWR